MDSMVSKDGDQIALRATNRTTNSNHEVDLERGVKLDQEDTTTTIIKEAYSNFVEQAISISGSVYRVFVDENLNLSSHTPNNKADTDNINKPKGEKTMVKSIVAVEKDRRKKSNSKKPPRPPKGPSLDAADQKLIKEITELARLKRARIERMRALKKMKAEKAASSASASASSGSLLASVFTLLFCLVVLFQGITPRATITSFQGSPLSAQSGSVSIQFPGLPLPNQPRGAAKFVEQISGLDHEEILRRVATRKLRL